MHDEKGRHKEMIRLVIVLNPEDGKMNVHGPTHDKSLCMNMLAEAIKAIANQAPQVIVPASRAN
jgi:hypothetical protein